MSSMLRAVFWTVLTVAMAQSVRLEFDAASIKVNVREVPWQDTRNNCGLNGMGSVTILPGGRVRAQRALLSCVIQGAYVVRSFQVIGGPDWINSVHYDIDAKSDKADISAQQSREMLQALLADRFKLRLR